MASIWPHQVLMMQSDITFTVVYSQYPEPGSDWSHHRSPQTVN